MKIFAERLTKVLEDNKLSKADFAKEVGVSHQMISDYCGGKKDPSLEMFVIICKTLREDANFLLGLDE